MKKENTFIGSGHIVEAMVAGMIRGGIFPENLIVSNPSGSNLARMAEKYGIQTSMDNIRAIDGADLIFLGVKPKPIKPVLKQIGESVGDRILVSMAACVPISFFESYKAVRIMPNIPVSVNQGVIGLLANNRVSEQESLELKNLLDKLGLVIEVKTDGELDLITTLSGCGPGVAAYLMNLISEYGTQGGLSQEVSIQIVTQTFMGTLAYMSESGISAGELVVSVATKGGVTEKIISTLAQNNLTDILHSSLAAGYNRIKEVRDSLI